MDKAVVGYCRVGYFRVGVLEPWWDDMIAQIETASVPAEMAGKTPCVQGYAKQGQTRHGVRIPLFDQAAENLEKVT